MSDTVLIHSADVFDFVCRKRIGAMSLLLEIITAPNRFTAIIDANILFYCHPCGYSALMIALIFAWNRSAAVS